MLQRFPRPALAFARPALAFALVTTILLGAAPSHAAFGIRYVIPGATRLETGTFSSQSHVDLLVKDPDGAARVYDAENGTLVCPMPATFKLTGWQRLVGDFDVDGLNDILTWTNLAGGGAQIELYKWNGSAMVRAWSVTRPNAVDQLQQVACLPTESWQLAVVTAVDSSRGLDVLDALNGSEMLSIAPVPQASVHIEADSWDTADGTDVLFAALDGTGKGTWRLVGNVGGTMGVKWSYTGKYFWGAHLLQPNRRDLLMVNTSNQGVVVNANTGTEAAYLGYGFVTDGSVVSRLVDVDYDGVEEVLQGMTLFRMQGNTLIPQWTLPSPNGPLEDVVNTEMDGNFASTELVFRNQGSLEVVDGVTGSLRFRWDNEHASTMWCDDLMPGGGQECLAYFPHDAPTPSNLMMIGLVSPGTIGIRYQRSTGVLMGLDAYAPNKLCTLELNVAGTSASLHDVAADTLVATLPSAFSLAPSTVNTLTDLDGDGAPELLQQTPPGGGTDGTRLLEWNGTNYALVWKVSNTYPASLPMTFAPFTTSNAQIGLLGAGGVLLLDSANGATIWDAAAQGFTSVVSAEAGSWETANSHAGVLMLAGGPTRPSGIYLLSSTAQPVGVGASAGIAAPRLVATPNPFRAASRVSFTMPQAGEVAVDVFDATGRRVRTLARGLLSVGAHAVEWDGRDERGNTTPAGIYWTRLTTATGTISTRLVRVP